MTQFKMEDYFAVLPQHDMHGRDLFAAVREGLWPFKAETIHSYLEFDISYNRYRLFVEVEFKDHYRIAHREFMDHDDLLDNPDSEMFRVSELMFKAFRYREDFHAFVPKTVTLGEN